MTLDEERTYRARLLRVHQATIAEQARRTGPDGAVLVVELGDEPARRLAAVLAGQLGGADSEVVVLTVDRTALGKATRGLWPTLSARYAEKAPGGDVWVLVIARGGATLASFSPDADAPGVGIVLVEGGRR